jgi:hypothetical protein
MKIWEEDVLFFHEIISSPGSWMETDSHGPVMTAALRRGPARVQAQSHGSGLAGHFTTRVGVSLAALQPDGHHNSGGAA